MKTIFVIALLLCGTVAVAQQKMGYIDSQKIIDQLPDAQDAKRKLDVFAADWQAEIKKRKEKLDKMFKEYQAKEILYTDELKKQKQKDIIDAEQDIQTYQNQKFGANGEYFQKQTDLMKPIQDRIFTSMREVAQEQNYDFVFDKSGEILLLYSKEEFDLTDKVLEKVSGRLRTGTATSPASPASPAPTGTSPALPPGKGQ